MVAALWFNPWSITPSRLLMFPGNSMIFPQHFHSLELPAGTLTMLPFLQTSLRLASDGRHVSCITQNLKAVKENFEKQLIT